MSRVGLANFKIGAGTPNGHDQQWREGLNREQWDHIYHALRGEDPKKKCTYRNAQTEAHEKLAKTWHIVSHVYSSAAGQGSYHYNLNKPTGNVHVYVPSASFNLVPGRTTFDGKNNMRYSGGVDDDLLRRQRDSYLWQSRNPYQQSAYNEAYYKEGLYNSDTSNVHGQRRSASAPGFPDSRQMMSRTQFRPPHHSINARLGHRPGIEQGGNGQGSSHRSGGGNSSSHRSRDSNRIIGGGGGPQVSGERTNVMAQTWSSGGFFPSNSSRGGAPIGGGQDRGYARSGEFIDASGDPNVKLHNRAEGGARNTAGPFFIRPPVGSRHGEGSTANRTAAGPLNQTWKGRSHQTRSVPPARRVNEPNAPSFQRIAGI